MEVENNSPALQLRLYVEKETGNIYEAQLFEKFVLVRHASPGYQAMLRKISFGSFIKEFEEYEGDPQQVYRILSGTEPTDDILLIN